MALFYTVVVTLLGSVVIASIGYLLLLLVAAVRARHACSRRPAPGCGTEPAGYRVAVIVPAHNEEPVLAATIASLRAQTYAPDQLHIVVVADNCTDRTAAIGREAGVLVLERVDAVNRGKGYALSWAISQLLTGARPPDAFVIVDADTWVAPDFVPLMAAQLHARRDERGCSALQGRYGVLNARDGWRATLMSGAFELFNHVRPLGSEQLGLAVGLKGNGMAFTREVLERAPWKGRSITEDIDFGLDLLQDHAIRVGYVPQARVMAQMPVTRAQASSQRDRWESGRYALMRQRALPLLARGLGRRDARQCDAAVQLLIPPLAELSAFLLGWGALLALGAWLGLLRNPALWSGTWACATLGFGVYVLGGMAVAEVPREVYFALLRAPVYVIWKSVLATARLFRARQPAGDAEWVRTERLPLPEFEAEAASTGSQR
jgi:glycosyltransferase involved in cell wall biosynthesis